MLANKDQDKNFNEKIVSKERLAAKKAKEYLSEVSEMLRNDDQMKKKSIQEKFISKET